MFYNTTKGIRKMHISTGEGYRAGYRDKVWKQGYMAGYRDTGLDTGIQGWIQGYRAGYWDTGLDTGIQGWIQGYRDTELDTRLDTGIQGWIQKCKHPNYLFFGKSEKEESRKV